MEVTNLKIYPRSPFMTSIVDYYQLVRINEPMMLSTLPNGRLDSWINLSGSFHFFDETVGRYVKAPSSGFFPLSTKSMFVQIREELVCLNIKFFAHALGYRHLDKLVASRELVSTRRLFNRDIKESVSNISPDDVSQIITEVEDYFTALLLTGSKEKTALYYILQRIEGNEIDVTSVKCLAREFNVTEKTLQRNFTRTIGLSPKGYSKIVRFQKAVQDIKSRKKGNSGLNMCLANGYYDQSHFGKDSKNIAGLAPKLLVKSLLPGFSDLILSE